MIDINKIINKEILESRAEARREIAFAIITILRKNTKNEWEEKEKEILDFCNDVIEKTEPFDNDKKITTYMYRPHKGTLADSMAEKKEFLTKDEMFKYIARNTFGSVSKEDLLIDEEMAVDDDRIGWKSVRMVLTKRYGDCDYMEKYNCPQCIGYCSQRQTTFESFWNRMYEDFVYRR